MRPATSKEMEVCALDWSYAYRWPMTGLPGRRLPYSAGDLSSLRLRPRPGEPSYPGTRSGQRDTVSCVKSVDLSSSKCRIMDSYSPRPTSMLVSPGGHMREATDTESVQTNGLPLPPAGAGCSNRTRKVRHVT